MKTLLILRHAKSSWNDSKLSDHERPLNIRGLRDAPKMAKYISTNYESPDLIISSTAVRAKGMADEVVKACPDANISFIKELYLASPEKIIDLIKKSDSVKNINKLMIIGHNPGLEELVFYLTKRNESFPTSALAVIKLDIANWSELDINNSYQLNDLLRPKEIFSES
jgi:phosphohistidine phosphatase